MELFKCSGILKYSENPYRLVIEVDQQLVDYYRALMPKWLNVERGRYSAHCTIVRPYKDSSPDPTLWRKYEGQCIEFLYEPGVHCDKIYYYLRVLSKQIEDIRRELGLPMYKSYTQPPSQYFKYWHITIGNVKRASGLLHT